MSAQDPNAQWTIGRIQRWTETHLAEKGIPNPRLDADLIIAHALEIDRVQVYTRFEQPLTIVERDRIRPLVRRRAQREPLAFITGQKEFFGRSFRVSPDVLIPRPETEHLVEAAVEKLKHLSNPTFLDLGCGSGCISVSLLAECPNARAVAVDISEKALEIAKANAEALGVGDRILFVGGSWFAPLDGQRFDLICANPPYIPSAEVEGLQPEVAKYEPRGALDGGEDGLGEIRAILKGAPERLAPGGELLMEIALGQNEAIAGLAESMTGWEKPGFIADYSGIPRIARFAPANGATRKSDG